MSTAAVLPMYEAMESTSKTFRGRSMESVLEQIRAELGEDALVLRCREGLAGGVGGFFQRPCVEIEAARRPAGLDLRAGDEADFAEPDVAPLEMRSDRATAEGMASPAVQLLLSQAAPFAEQLRAAQREPQFVPMGQEAAPAASLGDLRLYGPQPNVRAPEGPAAFTPVAASASPEPAPLEPAPAEPARDPAGPDPVEDLVSAWFGPYDAIPASTSTSAPAAPAPAASMPPAPERAPHRPLELSTLLPVPFAPAAAVALPDAAQGVQRRLVALGMESTLAADLVGEAGVHGAVFAPAGGTEALVRAAIEQRVRTLGHRGPGGLTLAVTGPAADQSATLVGHLAAAYAAAGSLPVVVVALRSPETGAALRDRLAGQNVRVELAVDGRQARQIADQAAGAMVLVTLPAVASAGDAATAALATDLDDLAADELHLALPATSSAAVADELAELLDPLGLSHVALTATDATRRPGAGLGFCLATGRALSYLCARDALTPATAGAVADILLP